jgi:VIT1/CCC1 family predicted Fe2+/Mn2+ transporter
MSTEADRPPDVEDGTHADEPHDSGAASVLLNWLRAAVLGANDGIVSTAGLVMGVAGATTDRTAILIAGLAGLVAGALSMAAGEYVSVSTQRDTEQALLAKERRELEEEPEEELAELAGIYRAKGLSDETARRVAIELTEHDALAAHADAELGIDPDVLTNPWHAAFASMIAFTIGALLPLLTITLLPQAIRVWATVASVVVALALTGFLSARFADADVRRAILRNVTGGVLAMAVTYAIGYLVGGNIA